MTDSAHYNPALGGWGGADHRFEDWSDDDYSDLADDPILAAQLAEDEKYDEK